MGAGGAVLLLLIGAMLLVFIVVGVILLIAAAVVHLSGKNPRPLAWAGVGVLAVPVIFVAGVAVLGQLTGDPDTVEIDLRDPVSLSSLPEDNETYPGMRDYDSDHIDLRLPDGRRFEAEVDGVLVSTTDGYVSRVTFDRRATEAGETETVSREWEKQLGRAGTVEIDPTYSDHGRVRAEVRVDPAP